MARDHIAIARKSESQTTGGMESSVTLWTDLSSCASVVAQAERIEPETAPYEDAEHESLESDHPKKP